MEFNTVLSDEQQQIVRILAKDAKGVVDTTTVATWSTSDSAIVAISCDSADTTKRACTMVAGNPGNADVTVVCGPLTHVIHVHVTVSDDSELDLSFDSPVAQPVAPPAPAPAPAPAAPVATAAPAAPAAAAEQPAAPVDTHDQPATTGV